MSVWSPNMHLSIEGDQVPIPHSAVSLLLRVGVLQRSKSPGASGFSESSIALLGKSSVDKLAKRKTFEKQKQQLSNPSESEH